MNTVRKTVAVTAIGLAAIVGMSLLTPKKTEPDKVVLAEDFAIQHQDEVEHADKYDLDGDGIKDKVVHLPEGAYFKSGAEPQGAYRRVDEGTDLANRMNEWNMLQLDGIGFPKGFELKGYHY